MSNTVDHIIRVSVILDPKGWHKQAKAFKVKETPKLFKIDDEDNRCWESQISKTRLGFVDTIFKNSGDTIRYRAWVLDNEEDITKAMTDITEKILVDVRFKYQEAINLYKHVEDAYL